MCVCVVCAYLLVRMCVRMCVGVSTGGENEDPIHAHVGTKYICRYKIYFIYTKYRRRSYSCALLPRTPRLAKTLNPTFETLNPKP